MNKFFCLLIMTLAVILLSACSIQDKNPSMDEPVAAKLITSKTSKPIMPSDKFYQSDSAIYFCVKITDFPKDTTLKAVWKHLDDNTEIKSEKTAQGTGYEAFTLKRSSDLFPSGQYEVAVTAVIGDKTLEAKGKFNIIADVKPVHLLNAVTSNSIDNQDDLNPIDVTSQFSQSDPVIYFIVQTKDLPEDTKVSCSWVYVELGDSLSHEIITSGSRNVSFSLKPEGSQKLPVGKYIVTVSAEIDNKTETISKEFEVK